MKKYLLPALFMCLYAGASAAETPKKSTDANLFGHVVDRETHEHLPYATVAVTGTAFGTTTDASGHYFLKNLPEGELTLEVRALGYAGYYEAHPEKPEEPRREDFTDEADYTESEPAGDWTAVNYDQNWKKGKAAFGTKEMQHLGTGWDTEDIWIRRTFELEENLSKAPVYLKYSHDDIFALYILSLIHI